jgi:hypothetical protein
MGYTSIQASFFSYKSKKAGVGKCLRCLFCTRKPLQKK